MLPPFCVLCGKEDRLGARLIEFARTAEDDRWDQLQLLGQPPNAQWFCAEHAALATEINHLTVEAAMGELERLTGLGRK